MLLSNNQNNHMNNDNNILCTNIKGCTNRNQSPFDTAFRISQLPFGRSDKPLLNDNLLCLYSVSVT